MISITERSQRDLTKRFNNTNIDWTVIERQLVVWGELFRTGKKLRLNLSFNYVETSQPSAILSRKTDKRDGLSTTQQMLTERATQLDTKKNPLNNHLFGEWYIVSYAVPDPHII